MTGPLEWGVRILGFARISRTGYAIFFCSGGGTRKNIFRVPATRKNNIAYPSNWGGRFLIFFKIGLARFRVPATSVPECRVWKSRIETCFWDDAKIRWAKGRLIARMNSAAEDMRRENTKLRDEAREKAHQEMKEVRTDHKQHMQESHGGLTRPSNSLSILIFCSQIWGEIPGESIFGARVGDR